MPGEQTPGDEAALEALRATALATKKQADEAAAALLAADPSSGTPLPASGGPPPADPPPGIDLATLQRLMSEVVKKSTEGLRDGITAITRENTSIKASQARLESQRRRVNDVGKSEGKTVSLAKQLDFTEDLLASLESIKDLALGIVLDKPAGLGLPAGPASPRRLSAKLSIVRTARSCTIFWRSPSPHPRRSWGS